MQSFRGKECTADALGRTWTFARWTLDILDAWTAWAKTQLPDPLAAATAQIERMMVEEERRGEEAKTDAEKAKLRSWLQIRAKIKDELVEAAMRQAASHLDFASREVQDLLNSPRGGAYLVLLLVQPAQPDTTPEAAFELWTALSDSEQQRVMETTMGRLPPAPPNGAAPAASRLPAGRGRRGDGSSKSR